MTPHRAREAEIGELLARVEAATGPDRYLDGEVWKALTEKPGDVWERMGGLEYWHLQDPNDTIAYEPPPRLTASIDAALALVERMLPGWRLFIEGEPGGSADDCYLLGPEYRSDGSRPDQSSPATAAATWPLAILTALLRALSTGAHQ